MSQFPDERRHSGLDPFLTVRVAPPVSFVDRTKRPYQLDEPEWETT